MTTETSHPRRGLPAWITARRPATAGIVACLLAAGVAGPLATIASGDETRPTPKGADDRPVIATEHEGPVKVAYQITTAKMKDGVNEGLLALKKLHASYLAAGADPARLDIRAVFHGDGAEQLLTDEAWNRVRGVSGGNPNTALIAELTRIGVHIELCNNHRVSAGWAMSDVHANVLLVAGAYRRLIDLQRRGYAYIRF